MALSDGSHILAIYRQYLTCTVGLQQLYPEIYSSAMNCILAETSIRSHIRTIFKVITLFCRSTGARTAIYPKADVILFNSSNKPSFGPAINGLAERLSRRGYRSVILSYERATLIDTVGNQSISRLSSFYRADSLYIAVHAAVRALYIVFKIQSVLIRNNFKVFIYISRRLISFWYELAISHLRLLEADRFFEATTAKLILTHVEKIPIANELVMASERHGVYSILFLCEHPDILTQPVYSCEIWAWNQLIADSIYREVVSFNGTSDKRICIVGHHESDYILSLRNRNANSLDFLLSGDVVRGRKIFIFISEYVKNVSWQRGPITRECVRWLKFAAVSLPDWLFVFKTRPYQSQAPVPGFDQSKESLPENLILYNGDKGLPEFLAFGNIAAAGALGSLGLFAASHCGIPSFRFVISDPNIPMAFLEEFAVVIDNPVELTANLVSLDLFQDQLNAKLTNAPYRGRSLDRMEQLVLEHLN